MKRDTRQFIYAAINFVFVPPPAFDWNAGVNFQKSLRDKGIDFSNFQQAGNVFAISRQSAPNLQIRLAALPPAPVAQLLMDSSGPGIERGYFCKEADAVVAAFMATWPEPQPPRQILSVDATFRDLFESTEKHAFEEIWVKWLGRQQSDLGSLGPIAGGGLRFIIPPVQGDSDPVMIDLTIESFLENPKKILVQTAFRWVKQLSPGDPMKPNEHIEKANRYFDDKIIPFMARGVLDGADE